MLLTYCFVILNFIPNIISNSLIFVARYEDANDVYDAILRKDETNTVVRKRKIAILKSQGKTSEAIRELVDYLKKYGV